MLKFEKIIKEIDDKGFSHIENYMQKKECVEAIAKFELILDSRKKKLEFIGNSDNQVLYNYFLEDTSLLKFVYNEQIFKLISKLLDADHVLTSTSARNKRLIGAVDSSHKTSGIGWHTDTRYVFENGFCGDRPTVVPTRSTRYRDPPTAAQIRATRRGDPPVRYGIIPGEPPSP